MAGISGFKSNHSLHATAASRLYHSNTDKQLIMAVTGHKSSDGVRSYKRTSDNQFKVVSDKLREKEQDDTCPSPKRKNISTDIDEKENIPCHSNVSMPPCLTVSGCGSVVININK